MSIETFFLPIAADFDINFPLNPLKIYTFLFMDWVFMDLYMNVR